MRRLVAEHELSVDDLVAPLFVREGIDEAQPIRSLPGVLQHTGAVVAEGGPRARRPRRPRGRAVRRPRRRRTRPARAPGIRTASCSALRDFRDEMGDRIVLTADLCLDEYTDHGHCGVLRADGTVDNDATDRAVRPYCSRAGGCGRRRRCAERDDGRPSRRHPRRARHRGSSRHGDPRLLREVRVGAVRAVPRRGPRDDRGWRRSQGLPAGLA